LITTNTRLEVEIRNIHLLETKRAFSIVLDMIARVSILANMETSIQQD
jgi:hypothetical protein